MVVRGIEVCPGFEVGAKVLPVSGFVVVVVGGSSGWCYCVVVIVVICLW